jgi:type I restriction enzyme, S subunit
MIEGLKPYAKRKPSGALWLPEIPATWDMRRNGRLFVERNETNAGELPILEVSLRTGVRVRNFDTGSRKQVMEDREKYKRARKGDLAYNMMRMWQGAVGVVPTDGLVSPAYVVARPLPGVLPAYFEYLFRTDAYKRQVNDYSRGIVADRNRLYWDSFKQIPTPFPPPDEQAAIVRFLDHADRQINRYIRAKRKLIALVNEQKQAIIHRAVTRGLDPNVKLKPSGVEWLGDVPEHWELRRVKNVARILRGKFTHRPRNDPALYDGPFPFIQTGEVARAGKTITSYRQTLNELGLSVSRMFPVGTLVMTIAANIGDVAVLSFEACFPDSVVGFVPRRGIDRDFLYYVFLAMRSELLREAPVNTQGNLNVDRIGSRDIVVPQSTEQLAIVLYIEDRIRSLTEVSERATAEIALLREYRARLVAVVVTGELDVRDAAARLPDFVNDDASDPIDDEEIADDEEAPGDDALADAAE